MNTLFSVGTRADHGPEPAYWQEFAMHLIKKMLDGEPVTIIMRNETHERLRRTCFRGVHLMKAGNFREWSSAIELFNDYRVIDHFLEELDELLLEHDYSGESLTIELDEYIGWESTAPLKNYPMDALEEFRPNRRSRALRVKPERTDLPAPLTRELTIIFDFKLEDDCNPTVIIHSVYPGVDIGELKGDITENEGRVFFDWNHPGER